MGGGQRNGAHQICIPGSVVSGIRNCLFWNSSTRRYVWGECGDQVVGGLVLQWKIIDAFSIALREKGFSRLQALILLTGG